MARWIAFDQQTSSLLRSSLARGTTVETFGRGAVDYALAKPGAVVTLLPAAGGIDVGIAVFRRPKKLAVNAAPVPVAKPRPLSGPAKPAAKVHSPLPPRATTRAGGFLGLSDESVIEEELVEEKKGWWRRFWDE
ncbi:MAG TPA: hypothetical protein VKH81_21530 [Candidatus Angelobacter sp.]|nr:hypothetical protein [Candidatus Angelobacter sp.]